VQEVELGSSLGEHVVRRAQPTTPLAAFLVGGYFGRWISVASAAQLRLTPERLGAGAIVAFPESVCALADVARVTRYLARESAGQCGPCKFGLAAIADAMEELARGRSRASADDVDRLRRWCSQVRGRGACRHPDGAAGFVESALTVFGSEVEQHARGGGCGRPVRSVLPLPAGGAW
jgi:NADH:ubiquinone oxidoreductase subunit F (NADH-binding)